MLFNATNLNLTVVNITIKIDNIRVYAIDYKSSVKDKWNVIIVRFLLYTTAKVLENI